MKFTWGEDCSIEGYVRVENKMKLNGPIWYYEGLMNDVQQSDPYGIMRFSCTIYDPHGIKSQEWAKSKAMVMMAVLSFKKD